MFFPDDKVFRIWQAALLDDGLTLHGQRLLRTTAGFAPFLAGTEDGDGISDMRLVLVSAPFLALVPFRRRLALFLGSCGLGERLCISRNRVPDREEPGKPRKDARHGRCHPLE